MTAHPTRRRDLIVVGASAGGVPALIECLSRAAGLDSSVLVALHFPAGGHTALPQILSRTTGADVRLAEHGAPLEPGTIRVAPPDHHLLVGRGGLRLSSGPRENRSRPAVDPLFRSAARSHGGAIIAVVLSGMLGDGAAGLAAVRRAGGYGIVQDPGDALFAGMPSSALTTAGADAVLAARDMPAALDRLTREEVEISVTDQHDRLDLVELDARELQRRTQQGGLTGLTCPECNGALWEHDQHGLVSYRCRVGHAFSQDDLDEAQSTAVEDALWMAVRVLEERASLLQRSAERIPQARVAQRMLQQAEAALGQAQTLRELLNRSLQTVTGRSPAHPSNDQSLHRALL